LGVALSIVIFNKSAYLKWYLAKKVTIVLYLQRLFGVSGYAVVILGWK
jgi:hypothetical protein